MCVCTCICYIISGSIHPSIHPFISPPITHPPIYQSIQSVIHPSTQSFIHPFTHPCIDWSKIWLSTWAMYTYMHACIQCIFYIKCRQLHIHIIFIGICMQRCSNTSRHIVTHTHICIYTYTYMGPLLPKEPSGC